ncbi:MAG: NOB1 family endonuclease [Candidatus Bathyarchaeia archaeon]
MSVYVLDTSAFIMGINPSVIKGRVYSVPDVEAELSPRSMAAIRFRTSRENGDLVVRAPTDASLKSLRKASLKLGEVDVLSSADLKILALSLDLRLEGLNPIIVSDDYAIQNVAEHLDLDYVFLATFGIKYGFNWFLFCPACFRRYHYSYSERVCKVCGSTLKRRVLKKYKRPEGI